MSFLSQNCITCGATDCECTNPAIEDLSCANKNLELAEIKELFFQCPDDTDPSAAKVPITGYVDSSSDETINDAAITTWIAGITNAADGIKRIPVIGSIGAPEETVISLPDAEETVINRRYTGSFRVPNPTVLQRNWFNWVMSCEPDLFFQYLTRGCGFYGGEHGIPLKSIKIHEQNDEGTEAVRTIFITLIWETRCLVPRDYVPLAA